MLGNLGFKGENDLYKEYDQPLSKADSYLGKCLWNEMSDSVILSRS